MKPDTNTAMKEALTTGKAHVNAETLTPKYIETLKQIEDLSLKVLSPVDYASQLLEIHVGNDNFVDVIREYVKKFV